MRTHGRFADIRPYQNRDAQRRLVRDEYLVAARVETSWSSKYEGLLDLVFSDGASFAVVPMLVVDGVMLIEQEAEILQWPVWMNWLDLDEADRIEEAVAPWLRSLTLARFENGERLRIFTNDAALRAKIGAARSRGWMGASPSEIVVKQLSPYGYAQRFVSGRAVAIVDAEGANGAALLARTAGTVVADLLDEERMRAAAEWFDLDVFRAVAADERADVVVSDGKRVVDADIRVLLDAEGGAGLRTVEVATPLPMGVMLSFDTDDALAYRHFAVASKPLANRHITISEPAPIGGSGGRIALVVRDDAARLGDADTDAARILERRLRAEGFEANIVTASRLDVGSVDLVHVFGWRLGGLVLRQLEIANAKGIPVALTPYADDPTTESEWGEKITLTALRNTGDREMAEEYFEAIGLRKLVADQIERPETPKIDQEAVRLFGAVGTVFVTCPEEEGHVRTAFGFGGTAIGVPGIVDWITAADVGSLVGPEGFILAHGQVESRTNYYALARVAEHLNLPLVIVGQVRDAEYYTHMIGAFGPRAVWLPENQLAPSEVAGLYVRARVFADLSWSGLGLHRLGRAAWVGASLVVSSAGWAPKVWGEAAVVAEPASLPSIEAALKRAWDEAPQRGRQVGQVATAGFDPRTTLVATVKGYQQAAVSL